MDGSSVIGKVFSVIGVLLAFVLILYLAHIASKVMGKRMTIRGTEKNIKVLETLSVGQGKSIIIVQSAGKTFLVGVTNEKMSLISELDSDMLNNEPEVRETMEFSKAFKRVLEKNFGKKLDSKEKNDDKKS